MHDKLKLLLDRINLPKEYYDAFLGGKILKLKLDTCIKEFKNAINRNEFSIVADFTPEGKDNFFVDCKIVENNKTIFSIRIFAGSREQAKIICDNWKHNAQTLYPQFLELLRGK